MLKKHFIDLLRCPETRQSLSPMDADVLSRLNEAIGQGKIKNRVGNVIRDPVEDGLVRHDGQGVYPVKGDIPILLADEGIPLNQLTPTA